MLSIHSRLFTLIVTVAVTALSSCTSQKQVNSGLQVGAGIVDITPSDKDALDPLLAKALVFRQDNQLTAIVVCDVIGISGKVSGAARKLASEQIGIPAANICIAATHTHSGGYCDNLVDRIVLAIDIAYANLQPATLSAVMAQEDSVSFNRRFLMVDGTIRFNPGYDEETRSFDGGNYAQNPEIVRPVGPIDPDVGVILLWDKQGRPFTSLVNHALHVCTCPGMAYSADYPYWLAQTLQQNYGERFVSVFGTGTCGDINHIDPNKPFPQLSQKVHHEQTSKAIGQTLAKAVVYCENRPARQNSYLTVRSRIVDVPLQTYTAMDLAWAKEAIANDFKDFPGIGYDQRGFLAGVRARKIIRLETIRNERGDVWPLEVQAIRLSPETAIVTLPGEIFVELGLSIKERSPFVNTFIIELASENCFYVPTCKAFAEGSYETVNSLLIPGGGEMLVDAAVEMLNELKIQR